MHVEIKNKANCSGCTACASVCPKKCIKMIADSEGFLYPSVDKNACIQCGLCKKICPVLSKTKKTSGDVLCFSVCNKDDEVRACSSSGGVFSALAKEVLKKGGAVFGSAFDDDLNLLHICAAEESELARLRGSKYIKSDLTDSFLKIKELLSSGVPVLFSGTPCQTDGLVSFLGGKRDNLFVVDIICHGTPSPLVWKEYLSYKKEKNGSEVTGFVFRDKTIGWRNYSVTAYFGNGSTESVPFFDDPYMKAFLTNLSLRPSCHSCGSKSLCRSSDITLGDFWGIERVAPYMDDNRGTSIVMVHTQKGKELFASVADALKWEEVPFEKAINGNPSFHTSSPVGKKRDLFFSRLGKMRFDKLVSKCLAPSFPKRVIKKLVSFFG